MKTKEIDERFDKLDIFYIDDRGDMQIYEGGDKKIKDFIHKELSTLRQSVLEEVSNGLPQDKRRSTRVRQDLTEFEEGFNDCLDQVTSLINNLIEEK